MCRMGQTHSLPQRTPRSAIQFVVVEIADGTVCPRKFVGKYACAWAWVIVVGGLLPASAVPGLVRSRFRERPVTPGPVLPPVPRYGIAVEVRSSGSGIGVGDVVVLTVGCVGERTAKTVGVSGRIGLIDVRIQHDPGRVDAIGPAQEEVRHTGALRGEYIVVHDVATEVVAGASGLLRLVLRFDGLRRRWR